MTNKIQLITALTLATILIAGGVSMTPLAYSTGSSSNNDKKWDDKKDKEGGADYSKFKQWKNNHDEDDDDEHDDKVKVCHVPPGNVGNAHTLEISSSAVAAHLAHGDTMGACPDDDDDTVDKLTTITFLRAITNDNGKSITLTDFTVQLNGTTKETGIPIDVIPGAVYFLTGTVQPGFSFVLIAGETGCPSTLAADPFTVKNGKSIVCTIYYDDDFVPIDPSGDGVFFARNSIQMNIAGTVFNEAGSLHGCSNVPDGIVRPCVTEESVTGQNFLLIVDPAFDENGGDFAAVVYTVQPESGNTGVTQCSSIVGIDEHTFISVANPVRGFILDCSAIDDPGNYNINYAIIKTTPVPTS